MNQGYKDGGSEGREETIGMGRQETSTGAGRRSGEGGCDGWVCLPERATLEKESLSW